MLASLAGDVSTRSRQTPAAETARRPAKQAVTAAGLIGRWGWTPGSALPGPAAAGRGAAERRRRVKPGINLFRLHATLDLHVKFHYRPALTTRPRQRRLPWLPSPSYVPMHACSSAYSRSRLCVYTAFLGVIAVKDITGAV